MAALAACDEPEAREALAWARRAGETRESSLVGTELALRMGSDRERTHATAHVEKLLAREQSGSDPWVLAIAADLDARCP